MKLDKFDRQTAKLAIDLRKVVDRHIRKHNDGHGVPFAALARLVVWLTLTHSSRASTVEFNLNLDDAWRRIRDGAV